jgi:hypothetical protein
VAYGWLGFDKHLARFFWEGIGDKRKIYWVNWPEVCRPKYQEGLGVMKSRFLNIALMTKWIWRLFDPGEHDSLWFFKLLQAKYVNTDNMFASFSQGGSQFWRSLNKIKQFFKLGAKFEIGNGHRVLFWTDWWLGEAPLAIAFLGFMISAPRKTFWSLTPCQCLLRPYSLGVLWA